MCQGVEQKITGSLYLDVGHINSMRKDKAIALKRARRGTAALGLEWTDLVRSDRRGHIAETRHIASLYLRECGFTFREISESLGRINHTTSVYSVRKAEQLLETYEDFRDSYTKFKNA